MGKIINLPAELSLADLHTLAVSLRQEVAAFTPAPPRLPVRYATASQTEEIGRLVKHPRISRQHKTRVLVNIRRLDTQAAALCIRTLHQLIAGETDTVAA